MPQHDNYEVQVVSTAELAARYRCCSATILRLVIRKKLQPLPNLRPYRFSLPHADKAMGLDNDR